jgi:predicted nucleotide-binding protein
MTADELRRYLEEQGVDFRENEVPYGRQFRCAGGEVFIVYDKGTLNVHGKVTDLAQAVRELEGGRAARPLARPRVAERAEPQKPVFIVYGHDRGARDGLELLLRRMGLDPIVLVNLPAAGDTIIEKLERYLGEHDQVGFACVLLTPDDEGYPVGREEEKKYRARQNVVLELGMVLARLGRQRVAILHKRSVELPSDIAGLIYIPFEERVDEVKAQLFKELREAGYEPDAAAL